MRRRVEGMVRKNAVAVMLAVLAAGCTAMRQDKYCKWALPVWGAALGGAGGGLGVSKSGDGDRNAAEIGGGAAGGAIAGGLLGWLVGHYVCEEAPEVVPPPPTPPPRSEEHTSELQSPYDLVCRLLLEKKK